MTSHQTATRLAALNKRLKRTTEPLERQAIKDRIRTIAHAAADAEYRSKAAELRRDMAGAY